MRFMAMLAMGALCLTLTGCAPKSVPPVIRTENVTSITVSAGGTETVLTDEEWVKECAARFAEMEGTRRQSVNDAPYAENVLNVSLEGSESFFVYEQDGKTYAEVPYTGIWRMENGTYEMIMEGIEP